jgi:hypothetical protein
MSSVLRVARVSPTIFAVAARRDVVVEERRDPRDPPAYQEELESNTRQEKTRRVRGATCMVN